MRKVRTLRSGSRRGRGVPVGVRVCVGMPIEGDAVGVGVGLGVAVPLGDRVGVAVGIRVTVCDGVGRDVAVAAGFVTDGVCVGVSCGACVGGVVRAVVGVAWGEHPYSDAFTALRISSMVTKPSVLASAGAQSASGVVPSVMFTPVMISSIDTSPSALQSPMQRRRFCVGVALGVGVCAIDAVAVGVWVATPTGFVFLAVGVAVTPGVSVGGTRYGKFTLVFSPTDTKTGISPTPIVMPPTWIVARTM